MHYALQTRARYIAGGVTFLVALLLMLLCLAVSLNIIQEQKPHTSDLAMAPPEQIEEEMFVEPLLQDAGQLQEDVGQEAAPLPEGTPDQAPVPNERLVVSGKNEQPSPEAEPKVATKKPSPVKTSEPSKKDEADQRIASSMKGKFSPHNGKPEGKGSSAQSGAGGTGTAGYSGSMGNGRKLLSCPLPSVHLTQKVVIVVEVQVNAAGHVTSAKARSGGSADASLRRAVENSSMKATWTPKTGAPLARGTITWTLKPKI